VLDRVQPRREAPDEEQEAGAEDQHWDCEEQAENDFTRRTAPAEEHVARTLAVRVKEEQDQPDERRRVGERDGRDERQREGALGRELLDAERRELANRRRAAASEALPLPAATSSTCEPERRSSDSHRFSPTICRVVPTTA